MNRIHILNTVHCIAFVMFPFCAKRQRQLTGAPLEGGRVPQRTPRRYSILQRFLLERILRLSGAQNLADVKKHKHYKFVNG